MIRRYTHSVILIYFFLHRGSPIVSNFSLVLIGEKNHQGELQYFIGVQLDGSDHVEPLRNRLSEGTEQQSAKLVRA